MLTMKRETMPPSEPVLSAEVDYEYDAILHGQRVKIRRFRSGVQDEPEVTVQPKTKTYEISPLEYWTEEVVGAEEKRKLTRTKNDERRK